MQKRIFLSPPWVGEPERAAVEAAFDSGYVAPCGPMVDAFDRRLGELTGTHAAAVASGTAALDLLMEELKVGPETIVLASTLTFIATVGPAWHRGAQPIFIDADPLTGTISLPLLERALRVATRSRKGTKRRQVLVLAADIYGQCCDYDGLESLCETYGATLIIDAAEAVGATCRDRAAGAAGFASVLSFNGNKIMTTSGGGAVLSRDPEVVSRARWRAQQARENAVWYEHCEVGYNYRMSNLLAAVGCAQLDRLPEIIRRKRKIFDFYQGLLCGDKRPGHRIAPYPCGDFTNSTRWLSVFIFPSERARDAAAAALTAANIESRPVWKPLHLQPVFRRCRVYGGDVSEDLFRRGLCLPSGAGLTRRQLMYIAEALV
ncbi:MAG: DegT/DnrJ/EryC1/StrS family aminotransferase [Kiritimatiellae bacterium]|nr:DegT/DnrJ/EryC1/StrS family aminotransferase [Kiritimatiellia bacterium]